MRRFLRLLGWTALALATLCAGYVGFALVTATFFTRGSVELGSGGGTLIHVCATPVHADILLPVADSTTDWRSVFPTLLPQVLPADAMLAFGWGDLQFFRDVPEWSDLTVTKVAAALAGLNDTALRVSVVMPPPASAGCVAIHAGTATTGRLTQFILSTLKRGTDGKVLRHHGGSRFTGFFAAHGRYSPFRTCNQWVADAMAEAGLPHAPFSPFSFGVLWPLSSAAPLR